MLLIAFHIATLTLQAAAAQAPHTSTLEASLRIPADALPAGCSLDTSDPQANPSIGADKNTILRARMRVGGASEIPDGPPLSRAETARFYSRLADGIKEGYEARYKDGEGQGTLVDAVRFANPEDARSLFEALPRKKGSATPLILHRDTVVAVQGRGVCPRAIVTHLRGR